MPHEIQQFPPATARLTRTATTVLAVACGLLAANLYYAQPLTGLIGADLHMPATATGLFVTLTQLGYGIGLLFVVPLGDLLENRRLVTVLVGIAATALLGIYLCPNAGLFLVFTLIVGIGATTVQVLLPFAAHFATDRDRGRVIGALTSGLMLGILFARPVASLETYYYGWRAVFATSAAMLALLAVALAAMMPGRRPASSLRYRDILRSLPRLWRELPLLRRRTGYHAALYTSFSLFWTAAPLLLAGPRFGLTQREIAFFALAGAGGVVIAPVAGWIADKGWTRPATGFATGSVLLAFAIAFLGGVTGSVAALVVAAILIDVGLVTNFVLSQRAIYGTRPDARSRIGALFTAIFFTGGAAGSLAATASLAAGGWPLATAIGATLAVAALLAYATELRPAQATAVTARPMA